MKSIILMKFRCSVLIFDVKKNNRRYFSEKIRYNFNEGNLILKRIISSLDKNIYFSSKVKAIYKTRICQMKRIVDLD